MLILKQVKKNDTRKFEELDKIEKKALEQFSYGKNLFEKDGAFAYVPFREGEYKFLTSSAY